uniref:CUE domain-containing protein n=1 Tax=Trichuris muris TaxID=70415 RepID=A0A5S6QHG5_TRIMR
MAAAGKATSDRSQDLLAKTFLMYKAPLSKKAEASWLLRTETLVADCEWLLSLDSRSFFSLLSDPSAAAWDMVDSYLKNCPRFYERPAMEISFFNPDPLVSNSQRTVHRLIFLILLRAAGIGVQDDLCTEIQRVDVPLLCDVCVLFGQENEELVKTLVCGALDAQPPLVAQFIEFTRQVQCLMSECGRATAKLVENHACYDARALASILNFLVDLVVTLTRMLIFFPNAAFIFEHQGLAVSVPPLYCDAVCPLCDYVNGFGGRTDIAESKGKLLYIRKLLLDFFNSLINSNVFERLAAFRSDADASREIMANYFNLMRALLRFEGFAADYEFEYPFAKELEKLFGDNSVSCFDHEVAYLTDQFSLLGVSSQSAPSEAVPSTPASSPSAIGRIREFVPSYVTDKQIEELLKRFDGSEERVVNAIMDNCFEDEVAGPSTSSGVAHDAAGNAKAAHSSAANDEEVEQIYEPLRTGKKRGAAQDVVRTKAEVDMLKGFYTNYVQTLDVEDAKAEYSDEYDDTYED